MHHVAMVDEEQRPRDEAIGGDRMYFDKLRAGVRRNQEYTFDAGDFPSRVAWTCGADSATGVRAFPAAPRRTDQEETA